MELYFVLFTACGHWWANIFTVQHFSPWPTIFSLSHVSIFQFASAQSRPFPFMIDHACCWNFWVFRWLIHKTLRQIHEDFQTYKLKLFSGQFKDWTQDDKRLGCFFAAKILGAGVPAKTGFIKDNPAGLSLITNHVWRDTFHTDILWEQYQTSPMKRNPKGTFVVKSKLGSLY